MLPTISGAILGGQQYNNCLAPIIKSAKKVRESKNKMK